MLLVDASFSRQRRDNVTEEESCRDTQEGKEDTATYTVRFIGKTSRMEEQIL
jgi:hypothetical protein